MVRKAVALPAAGLQCWSWEVFTEVSFPTEHKVHEGLEELLSPTAKHHHPLPKHFRVMNTFQRATLGNFPLSLGRTRFYHSLFPEQPCRGNESRYENQLLPASNTTPNPSLDRFPVPQGGQAVRFLLSAPQLPFSPHFPKEALGLLLPMLPPPWQLLNSSLVPGEIKTNIRRALIYSSCQWTHTAPAESGTQPPRFGVCYNEW